MPLHLLFDLDDTLYPREAGVMQAIGGLIRQYIAQTYGHTPEQAGALARQYHEAYGTSMRGLLLHNNLDVDRFLHYVHDFPVDNLLAPNPALDAMLARLPGQKAIFTNADRPHAERVLDRLGIAHHFTQIVDVVAVGYISKPTPEAYLSCLRLLDARPQDCIMIEDSARNLTPAAQLGMTTILVDAEPNGYTHFAVDNILEIEPVIDSILASRNQVG